MRYEIEEPLVVNSEHNEHSNNPKIFCAQLEEYI